MGLDAVAQQTLRLMHAVARGPANEWLSPATVQSYDAATHTVRCTLQPSGRLTGALPVLGMWPGMAHALRPGYQGAVGLVAGVPWVFLGTLPSDDDPPPDAALSIEGDVVVAGLVMGASGLRTSSWETLPPAGAAYDSQIITVRPSDNSAPGKAYVCLASADGTYHWVLLCAAP